MTEPETGGEIRTALFDRKIFSLKAVDSTNSYASSLLHTGAEEGTVIVAQVQTAGRGRQGRVWESEEGKNLTFSIILKPDTPAEFSGIISLYAALSVAEVLRALAGITPECKWPNDVLAGGRKLCGILSEATLDRGRVASAIVGIGLNVNQTHFPSSIQPPPTSLLLATGRPFDLKVVLSALLERLEFRYSDLRSRRYDTIIAEWKSLSTTIGRALAVPVGNRMLSGLATGIAADGGLLVQVDGVEKKILAGDITTLP